LFGTSIRARPFGDIAQGPGRVAWVEPGQFVLRAGRSFCQRNRHQASHRRDLYAISILWVTANESGGRAMDNCFTKRLWRSLKYEEIYLKEYLSPVKASISTSPFTTMNALTNSSTIILRLMSIFRPTPFSISQMRFSLFQPVTGHPCPDEWHRIQKSKVSALSPG